MSMGPKSRFPEIDLDMVKHCGCGCGTPIVIQNYHSGNHIVDWTTGDPGGDRAHLFRAYRDFLTELKETGLPEVLEIFGEWSVEDMNIDDFPRISIFRPEDKE